MYAKLWGRARGASWRMCRRLGAGELQARAALPCRDAGGRSRGPRPIHQAFRPSGGRGHGSERGPTPEGSAMTPRGEPVVDLSTLAHPGDAGYIEVHLHVRIRADDEGLRLHRVHCSCRESGFEARDLTPAPLLVFVEQGSFRRRTPAGEVLVDVGFAYFASPGGEEEYAHHNDGGDISSSITISIELLSAITGGDLNLPHDLVPI